MNFNITKKDFNNEDMTYTAYGIQADCGIVSVNIDDVSTEKDQVCLYIKRLETEASSIELLPDLVSRYIEESFTVVM